MTALVSSSLCAMPSLEMVLWGPKSILYSRTVSVILLCPRLNGPLRILAMLNSRYMFWYIARFHSRSLLLLYSFFIEVSGTFGRIEAGARDPSARACLIPRGWRLRRALEAGDSISFCVLCWVHDS